MQLGHLADPERHATIEVKDAAGILVVHWQPEGGGKRRRKTIDRSKTVMPVENAWHGALKLLFGEGFVLRGPREAPLQWLTCTREDYPHGFPFAVDPRGDHVWVADTGALRRIRRRTVDRVDVSIGEGVMPRDVVVGADGTAFAVLDLEQSTMPGTPPFRAPATGKTAFGLVRVTPDLEIEGVATVPHGDQVGPSVGVTVDGHVLGPHAEGSALYAADGTVLRTLPTARCQHWMPRAAVSPSAAWFASLTADRALRLEGPDGATVLPVTFDQLLGLAVDDEGTCLASGLTPGSGWGLHRVRASGEHTALSSGVDATLGPGGDSVLEMAWGAITERTLDGRTVRELPVPELTMNRRGRVLVAPDGAWIARTDAHTLAEIDPSRIAS